MQHWYAYRNPQNIYEWIEGPTFGSGIPSQSPPCMIEGPFGPSNENGVGNFELCVAANGQVQHWARNNQSNELPWIHRTTFGHGDIRAVTGLLKGSMGFNLEVIVLTRDNHLRHYWQDGGGWHEGRIIGSA